MTTQTAWMPQPFTVTTEVPLLRSSVALPIEWAAMVKAAEASEDPEARVAQFIPRDFWVKVRMKPDADVKTEAVKGWLKAAFTGWRAGEEKRRDGKLIPFGILVVESTAKVEGVKDLVKGHTLYIVPQDLAAREAAIERAKKGTAKKGTAKKAEAPAKKAAKKAATRKTTGGIKTGLQAAE